MVCEWFGLKTTRTVFTGLASKPVVTVSSGLASKLAATVFLQFGLKTMAVEGFPVWPQNLLRRFFSSLASKLVAIVSPSLASKLAVGFFIEPQNHGGGGFSGLGLNTDSSDLVIWTLKSPRRFLALGLKTKQASVCRLRHKTNGGRSAWDTHRDLAACFTWNQVWLWFFSLA
jgi:hypothetical protein